MWTYAGTYNDGTKRTSLFVWQLKLRTSDVCWYLAAVELWVASVLPGKFLQPEDFAHDVFRASRWSWSLRSELQSSLALLLFVTGKSCSSLFTLHLKTALSLALVRFYCFLVHSIYSGDVLVLNKLQEGNCIRKKVLICGFVGKIQIQTSPSMISCCKK